MSILVALGKSISSEGWLIGVAAVGRLLFPTNGLNSTQEGPRLGDLTVTGSSYGSPIAIGYGTVRMAGQMIWSSGIREEKNVFVTRTSGKGGGGGSRTSMTYSYYASFALGFAEGVAADVLRLWADGKLIFDKTGTGDRTQKDGLDFRFYSGNETQMSDPLMESDLGVGNTPAHRGLCYLVFENLPLADFGNHIPNITAEITFKKTSSHPYKFLEKLSDGPLKSYQRDELAIDRDRGIGYFIDSNIRSNLAGIRCFNLQTMKEDRQVLFSDVVATETEPAFPSSLFCGRDGYLYLISGSSNSKPVLRIDLGTMREVGRFGYESNAMSNSTRNFVTITCFAMISAYGISGRENFLLTGSLFNDVGVIRAKDMSYVWGSRQEVAHRVQGTVSGKIAEGFGEGWILSGDSYGYSGELVLYRIRVDVGARYETILGQTIGVTFEEMVRLYPTDIEVSAINFYSSACGLTYDQSDDSVIFQCRISNATGTVNTYTLKWCSGLGIVWKTVVPSHIFYDKPSFNTSYISDNRWACMLSDRVIELDTHSGDIILNESWSSVGSAFGTQYFDGQNETIIVGLYDGWAKLYLGRSGGEGDPLSSIVESLCSKADFDRGDLDTSALPGDVPGYIIGRQTSIRGALETLASAYFFDVVESDNVLKFIPRGNGSTLTIEADELGPVEEEPALRFQERRTQAIELPGRVSVLYMDKARDYVQGTAQAKRIQGPVATVSSDNQISLELPIVLEASSAKQIAEKHLYASWIERSRYAAAFDQKYLGLDPADVVTVQLENGSIFPCRIDRIDIGGDYSLKAELIAAEGATYVSSVIGDSGQIALQQIVSNRLTELILLNIPLLQDTDDVGGTGSRLYFLMGSSRDNPWTGGILYKSADDLTWDPVGRSMHEMAYGVLASSLDLPASVFATDEASLLEVFMISGVNRLESVTQLEMLNGANAALIIPEDGSAEVIQFRDIILQGDGSYHITGLLRGRRGTDADLALHPAGSKFVLLDVQTVQTLSLSLGEVGLVRSWRAVGFGCLFNDTALHRFTFLGNDLRPYAPVHVKAVSDKSGNRSISWVRRTRLGGDWRDGTGSVPFGEISERYEVEILSADGRTVVRVMEGLSSEAVSYSASDQMADFSSLPATIKLRVYQLSEIIGRGFPAYAEV